MTTMNALANEMDAAHHAYKASGYINSKIIWVIAVCLAVNTIIAILAPIIYLLIIFLILGLGASFCNVCGMLIIVLPLALMVPWGFGAAIGWLVNQVNIGMQKATHNNNHALQTVFMVFTVVGIVIVSAILLFGNSPIDEMEVESWVSVAVIVYGCIGMAIAMFAISIEEPLPPFCEPCLEYMSELKIPPRPVDNIHTVLAKLNEGFFFPVIRNEIDESEEKPSADTPASNVKKELVLRYYYCKTCMKSGVLEAVYKTEITKTEKGKAKTDKAERLVFSSMLTAAQVVGLTPHVLALTEKSK
jgi:hypothetical protein